MNMNPVRNLILIVPRDKMHLVSPGGKTFAFFVKDPGVKRDMHGRNVADSFCIIHIRT